MRRGWDQFPSFHHFLTQFHSVFKHSAGGESAEEHLLSVSQGNRTAADYALEFRTLTAQADWEERPLKLLYRKRLSRELQAELACRDGGRDLSEFMELSIQIDNLLKTRRSPARIPPSENTEPMQLGYTHLTPEERARRIRHQLWRKQQIITWDKTYTQHYQPSKTSF
ncbi:juxtaposed with another zinc finger protein 1a isoform X1, partial [Tachysurus ichikawai]